ncbi:hypothetical protein [Aeromonas veronii]|uniref:Uncharacterized protein n=1 Tax=Aeromonas veronii TaxID=654 RepID=A0AAW5M1R8_AERVE|nr:hypothetical protein [Aeromonas veronii]MCR4448098.1 hypothetical protein [Aeromonas veronii]
MINDLTWLARHIHAFEGGKNFITVSGDLYFYRDKPPHGISFSRDEWLARRAELQNKPSWADHPDAKCFFQHESGRWFKNVESSDMGVDGIGWRNNQLSHRVDCGWVDAGQGEVLGDWRDTLERRPIDLSEPAGGVKERGADGAEEINAIAQRLLVALKSNPRSFDTGALAEMVELADAEIVKRDAKVCGGEGYLNNHWFERGELPPVVVECEVRIGEDWRRTKVVAALNSDVGKLPIFTTPWCSQRYVDCGPEQFRPIRTERDLVVEEMKRHCPYHGSWDTVGRIYAEALYDAGYRKQG